MSLISVSRADDSKGSYEGGPRPENFRVSRKETPEPEARVFDMGKHNSGIIRHHNLPSRSKNRPG